MVWSFRTTSFDGVTYPIMAARDPWRLNQEAPLTQLRIVRSAKRPYVSSSLSTVPFRMLPVTSIESWRMRRLQSQLDRLEKQRPIALAVIERWVERLCEEPSEESSRLG